MTKDYYKILDISEFSTQDEIKNAYRRMVRKWHPDIAGSSDEVVSKFKEISEAYEILSDKLRKEDYDRARRFYNYAKTSQERKDYSSVNYSSQPDNSNKRGEYKKTGKKSGFSFNWEDFISKAYANSQLKKEQQKNMPKRGADVYADIEITVIDAINGAEKVINMLQTQVCPKCNGRRFVNGSTCSHCNGKGETSNLKKFLVKIPVGIKDKSKIRLQGEGENGLNGGSAGDLYLTVHIIDSNDYRTDGLNVHKVVQISPADAVLGTHIKVATPRGNVSVKISPNTKNGQKIRLSNCGLEGKGSIGDVILTVEIQIPKNLSNEEIELYKRLQELSSSKFEL